MVTCKDMFLKSFIIISIRYDNSIRKEYIKMLNLDKGKKTMPPRSDGQSIQDPSMAHSEVQMSKDSDK